MTEKKKFDLSKLNTTNQQFLKTEDTQASNTNNNSNKEKKKSGKVGRPMTTTEPLDKKITLNLSRSELDRFKKRAGQIPSGIYLREILKNAGVI